MKLCITYLLFIAICIHGATTATIRKQPAFATPVYSDSYLPAAMQAIFNIVEQLKRIDAEEVEQSHLTTSATSPHPPGQKQPLPTTQSSIVTVDEIQAVTVTDEEKYYISPEKYQEEALIIEKPDDVDLEKIISGQVPTEVNHEQSEVVYGLPETNYEIPEQNQEMPEETSANQESGLDTQSEAENHKEENSEDAEIKSTCNEYKTNSEQTPIDTTTSIAVDSIVKEIYSIIKTSSLDGEKTVSSSSSSSKDDISTEKSLPKVECIGSKNSPVKIEAEILPEDKERKDEVKDDERFTLLGERVDQVPRPSLVDSLRAANVTDNASLRQLGELYDALSRDARRQGFSKYAGYSDTVLKSLEESAGGGAGVQLRELLEKTSKNKELTRYDAMLKTGETIKTLNDEGSKLSTDLRLLLPLRFAA